MQSLSQSSLISYRTLFWKKYIQRRLPDIMTIKTCRSLIAVLIAVMDFYVIDDIIYIYISCMWQMSVSSHESAQCNDAGHLINENVFKTTWSLCYLRFRVTTLQANANKPFIVSSMKRTTGGGHLEITISRWPPPVVRFTFSYTYKYLVWLMI